MVKDCIERSPAHSLPSQGRRLQTHLRDVGVNDGIVPRIVRRSNPNGSRIFPKAEKTVEYAGWEEAAEIRLTGPLGQISRRNVPR